MKDISALKELPKPPSITIKELVSTTRNEELSDDVTQKKVLQNLAGSPADYFRESP